MEAYNRPLTTHIQCPSFKMKTMGQFSKPFKWKWLTNWIWKTILPDLYPPFFHALPQGSATRAWFGYRALPFGLNTTPRVFTLVTAPVVAYTHFKWYQPSRLTRRLAVKPYIGTVSQTATPMVISSLHTPRMGGKRGEVKFDSSGGHLFGMFARFKSRHCLSLCEEDRMMALHLGGPPSKTESARPGAPSFFRETSI